MPIEPSISDLVASAARAVEYAQAVRVTHARKSERGSKQRRTDIRLALERLAVAMRPIKRRIARLPYETPNEEHALLREASYDIQRERRKLWKMQQPAKRRN